MSHYNGCDVSEFQGSVDWATVQQSGAVAFAYARTGYSTWRMDKQIVANWKGMKAAGIPRGFYHFVVPSGTTYAEVMKSAQTHVAFALDCINKAGGVVGGDFPPWCDVEVTGGLSAAMLQDFVLRFAEGMDNAIKNPDQKCMLYTYQSFFTTYLQPLKGKIDLAIAAYGSTAPRLGQINWQHADNGSIRGVTGKVDLDNWLGAWPVPATPSSSAAVEALKKEYAALNEQYKALASQASADHTQIATLETKLAAVEKALAGK